MGILQQKYQLRPRGRNNDHHDEHNGHHLGAVSKTAVETEVLSRSKVQAFHDVAHIFEQVLA